MEFSFGLILESKNVLDTTRSGSLRNRFCSSIGRAAKSRHSSEQQPFNFLLQEMNREANPISSTSSDPEIIHRVVEIKEEVERLREQVQNLA